MLLSKGLQVDIFQFSACTALLFVLPIIFSKLTGFNPEKKDLIGHSDVLYCNASSEQSLCTVNMKILCINDRQKYPVWDPE